MVSEEFKPDQNTGNCLTMENCQCYYRTEIEELMYKIQNRIDYNWISCYLVDPDTGSLERISLDEEGFNMIEDIQFDCGHGLSAWVAEKKRPILLSSVHRGQRFYSNPLKSFICCPIIREGETIAVLNLGHIKNKAFNKTVLNRLLDILNYHENSE